MMLSQHFKQRGRARSLWGERLGGGGVGGRGKWEVESESKHNGGLGQTAYIIVITTADFSRR